jgi:hypothetical protein
LGKLFAFLFHEGETGPDGHGLETITAGKAQQDRWTRRATSDEEMSRSGAVTKVILYGGAKWFYQGIGADWLRFLVFFDHFETLVSAPATLWLN